MKKAQGLKTLGDYRRVAKDPKFAKNAQVSLSLFREGNGAYRHYHAIKVALKSADTIIKFAHEATIPFTKYADPWEFTCFDNTEYRMKNYQLFCAIRLMEFVNAYKDIDPINDIYTKWPKRPDANISVFTNAGISYLEAVFYFVRFLGHNVARELQNAYLRCTKLKGKANEVFSVLNNTHQTDNLQIYPEPDETIRVWFDEIVKWIQNWLEQYNISKGEVEKEFRKINTQLEYEWNCWKEPQETGEQDKTPKDKDTVFSSANTPHTKGLFPKQWAKIFKVGIKTIRNQIRDNSKNKKYHFEQINPPKGRKWSLPKSELPKKYKDLL